MLNNLMGELMKPTYKNDLSAPRMKKGRFSKMVITKELWKRFKEEYKEYKKTSDQELNKLWEDIAQTLRDEAISNPLGVKLGSYNGEIKLQYLPYKFEANNNNANIHKELGYKPKMLNILTRGKVAKIKWERRWAVKFNKMLQFYAFEPTRALNRLAKKYTDNNPEKIRVSRNTLGGKSAWRQYKKR